MEVLMSKLRIMFVSLLALFALGAVASASASAAACTASTGGGCLEEAGNLVASVAVSGEKKAGTTSELEVEGLGKIVCTTAKNSGSLEGSASGGIGVLPFKITFTGCTLSGSPTCTVLTTGGTKTGEIVTENIEGDVKEKSGTSGVVLFVASAASGTFALVEVAVCEKASKLNITGKQTCEFLLMETVSETHTLECLTTGSELFNGTKKAKFALDEVITSKAAKGSLGSF
jgi:hypothetical protein